MSGAFSPILLLGALRNFHNHPVLLPLQYEAHSAWELWPQPVSGSWPHRVLQRRGSPFVWGYLLSSGLHWTQLLLLQLL